MNEWDVSLISIVNLNKSIYNTCHTAFSSLIFTKLIYTYVSFKKCVQSVMQQILQTIYFVFLWFSKYLLFSRFWMGTTGFSCGENIHFLQIVLCFKKMNEMVYNRCHKPFILLIPSLCCYPCLNYKSQFHFVNLVLRSYSHKMNASNIDVKTH